MDNTSSLPGGQQVMVLPTGNTHRDLSSRRRWLAAAALPLLSCTRHIPFIAHVTAIDPNSPTGKETGTAIQDVLQGRELQLEPLHLHGNGHFVSFTRAAESVMESLKTLEPDLILAFGDEVMTHLVVPFLRQGPTPVIFGGVQWSANAYEVPNRFVTGIVEQPPVEDAIRMCLAGNRKAQDIFILAGDTPEVRRNRVHLDPIYWKNKLSTSYGLTPDFARWKRAFRWANDNTDIVYFISNSGIAGWDDEEALQHVRQYLRVPVFTCDPRLMPYAVAGRVNDPREQGQWMATQALRVLDGTEPGEIRLAYTSHSTPIHNAELAAKIGFTPPEEGN
jgi:ABC-type uncharacterized transport system substrate-binding protein